MLRVRPKAMTVAVIVAGLLPCSGERHGQRDHDTHCRADGRWHDYRAVAVPAGDSGGVSPDAPQRGACD